MGLQVLQSSTQLTLLLLDRCSPDGDLAQKPLIFAFQLLNGLLNRLGLLVLDIPDAQVAIERTAQTANRTCGLRDLLQQLAAQSGNQRRDPGMQFRLILLHAHPTGAELQWKIQVLTLGLIAQATEELDLLD